MVVLMPIDMYTRTHMQHTHAHTHARTHTRTHTHAIAHTHHTRNHTHTHTHTAYEVLSDSKKRQQYDQFGPDSPGGMPDNDDFHFNYDSFFNTDHFKHDHSQFNSQFKFHFDDIFGEFSDDERDPFGGFGFGSLFGGGGGGGGQEVDDGFGFGGMFESFGGMFGEDSMGGQGVLLHRCLLLVQYCVPKVKLI